MRSAELAAPPRRKRAPAVVVQRVGQRLHRIERGALLVALALQVEHELAHDEQPPAQGERVGSIGAGAAVEQRQRPADMAQRRVVRKARLACSAARAKNSPACALSPASS